MNLKQLSLFILTAAKLSIAFGQHAITKGDSTNIYSVEKGHQNVQPLSSSDNHFKQIKTLDKIIARAKKNQALLGRHGMGNGGNSVVCYTDQSRKNIQSVTLFDYWEQSRALDSKYRLSDAGSQLSVRQYIDNVVARLRKYQPSLAEAVEKAAQGILFNVNDFLISEDQIPKINDFTPKVLINEPNCFIEQFAVQWKDPQSGQRRFFISDKLYNSKKTSNMDKAGLILHEAIYRYAVLRGADNSDGIRYFNYMMSTTHFDNKNYLSMEYLKVLIDSNLNFDQCTMDKNGFIGRTKKFKPEDPILFRNKGYKCINSQIQLSNGDYIIAKEEYTSEKLTDDCEATHSLYYLKSVGSAKPICVDVYTDSYDDSYYILDFKSTEQNPNQSGTVLMPGPTGLYFDCSSAEKIIVDKKTGEIIECNAKSSLSKITLNDNGIETRFVTIHKNSLLNVYVGSVSPLSKNRSFKINGENFNIRVDVLPYTDAESNEIVLSSDNFLMGGKIVNTEGVMTDFLNADNDQKEVEASRRNKMYQKFVNIEHNGLKILYNFNDMSADEYRQAGLTICSKMIKNPKDFLIDSVLVDVWGAETFYDMNLKNKKVFTDEQVNIISAIKCY